MKIWYGCPTPFLETKRRYYEMLQETLEKMVRPGNTVEIHHPKSGYSTLSTWTATYNAVEGVKDYYKAWKTGYDGIVIGCCFDPGLAEARSIIDIPVVGSLESAVFTACYLGNKFSLVDLTKTSGAKHADHIKRYGLADRVASVRTLDISIQELSKSCSDPPKLIALFGKIAVKAAQEDGAEVIIPVCNILSTFLTYQKVHEIEGVPVLDPAYTAIKMAELLGDLKVTYGVGVCRTGGYAFPKPGWEKEIPIEV